MSGIRGKDTSPELSVRRFLHARGYRFRLHRKDFPGTPDLVLAKYKVAIFVHGCFWHQHQGCAYAATPATRPDFWASKLAGNAERDSRHIEALIRLGWRVLIIWECGLRHRGNELCEIEAFFEAPDTVAEWPQRPPKARSPK
ncbi:very short patch repair endonuclease [Cupriavidus sp. UGS-1]|nr:very short patch repair endonuclease [Cupriavidus sp. UGS-1]